MKYIFTFLLFCCSYLGFTQTKEEYYKKATAAYNQQDYVTTLRQLNQALLLDSLNYDYLFLKANTLFEMRQIQPAFDTYTKLIRLYPKDVIPLNQRGLLLRSVQEFEYSILDFDRALSMKCTDSLRIGLLVNRGASKIGMRNFEGAYDDFMIAYSIDSMNIGTLNNLAAVCDEVGKGDQTLMYLYKILKIDPNNAGAYVNIGFKFQGMGNYAKAIEQFDKVISIDPNEPLAYSNRSFNRLKMGDLAGAMADVNKSLSIYPENSYAYRNRALIYIAQKEFNKACKDLETAIEYGFTKMYGDEVQDLKLKYCVQNKP